MKRAMPCIYPSIGYRRHRGRAGDTAALEPGSTPQPIS
jgi:hypothetical protein